VSDRIQFWPASDHLRKSPDPAELTGGKFCFADPHLTRLGDAPFTPARQNQPRPSTKEALMNYCRSTDPATLFRVLLLALLLAAVPAWAQKADLSRLVVVGDSLSAGFQNGSLLDSQQPHGYAKLLADQARTDLALPLIAPPGFPNVLVLESAGPPPVIVRAPGFSAGRDDIMVQATNLAVPGQTVADALGKRPDFPIDSLTDLVLGLPGLLGGVSRSQVEWAEALAPTTIVLWLGNNDALGAAIAADTAFLTPVPDFESAYGQVIDRLAATGATLVTANIPDVTAVPFLTSADEVAARVGIPLEVIGPPLGIGPGDFVTPDAAPLIQNILGGATPGPLPGNVVLNAGEVATIRAAVDAYNAFIAKKAREYHAALVDIHELIDRVSRRGLVVNGQRLTTEFLGGLFSLDGVHPTNTGYAVIANDFIRALDRRFDADIPPVNVEHVAKEDPLVPAGAGRPPHKEHISEDTARALRWMMLHH
jgi:lysophospholipase L1-like esterase